MRPRQLAEVLRDGRRVPAVRPEREDGEPLGEPRLALPEVLVGIGDERQRRPVALLQQRPEDGPPLGQEVLRLVHHQRVEPLSQLLRGLEEEDARRPFQKACVAATSSSGGSFHATPARPHSSRPSSWYEPAHTRPGSASHDAQIPRR
ncbi:MAG: hypothetical protein IPP07_11095 [Holophagales bacterium]|nr:hypothetical protein [Holophagales bacterium]